MTDPDGDPSVTVVWPHLPTSRHCWTCPCGHTSQQGPGEDMGDWHVRIARHHNTCKETPMTTIRAEVDATVGQTTYEMSAYSVTMSTTLDDNPAFVTLDIPVDLGLVNTISVTVDRQALATALGQA